MSGSLVGDLGIGPEVWVFLSLAGCLTLFFKFNRVWSVRNLDLLLLFVLAPGLMLLAGSDEKRPLNAFILLFVGSACWLVRCLIDLGLSRRPMLEPNLNSAGLACLSVGILGLLLAESISLTSHEVGLRNPADREKGADSPIPGPEQSAGTMDTLIQNAPLPGILKPNPPKEILRRVLAGLAHLALVGGLITVGWWHYERPVAGLAMATCYLILPYARVALVDNGQLVPACLIVTAVVFYTRPALAGGLIGFAGWWMPACLGLFPLWLGFYRNRGAMRFAAVGLTVLLVCALLGLQLPDLLAWFRALGARSLAQAGIALSVEPPLSTSLWSRVDLNFRLPVLIAYITLVVMTSIWPLEKNLGELVALSAALLLASQFWYLDAGGALVVLYLPLILMMMFRPNLSAKRPLAREPRVKTVI